MLMFITRNFLLFSVAVSTMKCNVNAEIEFDVPEGSENPYYGRTAFLWNVTDALVSKGAAAILGVTEVGKTSAVLEFLHSSEFQSARIYDNYIWIDAESEDGLKDSFLRLARHDEINVNVPSSSLSLSELKHLVQEVYLKLQTKEGKSLIIFDNAYKKIKMSSSSKKANQEKDDQVPTILEFFPSTLIPPSSSGKIHVLITSRDVYAGWGENVKVFYLDIMTLDEVIKILYEQFKWDQETEPAKEMLELAKYFLNSFPKDLRYPVEYLKKHVRNVPRPEALSFIVDYAREMGEIYKVTGKDKEQPLPAWHDFEFDRMSSDIGQDRDHNAIIESLEVAYKKNLDQYATEENEEMIQIMQKLAEAYFYKNDFDNSATWYEKTLQVMKTIWGEDHHKTLDVQSTLGHVYFQKEKLPRRALELLHPVYIARKSTFGPTHEKTLDVLDTLVKIMPKLGLHKHALNVSTTLYSILKDKFGMDHPQTLSTLHIIAQSYSALKQHEKALKAHQKVYDIRKRTLGAEHADTISSMTGLAQELINLKQFERALEIMTQLIVLLTEQLGEEDPVTFMAMNQKAIILFELKRMDEAIELNGKVGDYARSVLGEEHEKTKLVQMVQRIFVREKKEAEEAQEAEKNNDNKTEQKEKEEL